MKNAMCFVEEGSKGSQNDLSIVLLLRHGEYTLRIGLS
jgi:hypothetical protein